MAGPGKAAAELEKARAVAAGYPVTVVVEGSAKSGDSAMAVLGMATLAGP
jgi:hypothetical protein